MVEVEDDAFQMLIQGQQLVARLDQSESLCHDNEEELLHDQPTQHLFQPQNLNVAKEIQGSLEEDPLKEGYVEGCLGRAGQHLKTTW